MVFVPEVLDRLVRCCSIGLVVTYLGASTASAQTSDADLLTYSGSDRTEKLIAGAKREGQVTYYSAMIVNQALRPLTAAFQKKYPFIKMTFWRADSEDIQTRMLAEVRANKPVVDIAEGTGMASLPSTPDWRRRHGRRSSRIFPNICVTSVGCGCPPA
jgi:iron(III) transport system substrate-binding protein